MTKKTQLVEQAFQKLRVIPEDVSSFYPQVNISRSPVITIARDPGSGGAPIAKRLAKQLKYDFYDEELLEAIALSSKKRKEIIQDLDETHINAIDEFVATLLNPDRVSQDDFVKHLISVVLTIAGKGKAVILGRGSNHIIPKHEGLHIYITAPLQTRITRAIRYEKIDIEEAKARIQRITDNRRNFVSQNFSKSYRNPDYYDLTLNTNFYSIDAAVAVIKTALEKKFSF